MLNIANMNRCILSVITLWWYACVQATPVINPHLQPQGVGLEETMTSAEAVSQARVAFSAVSENKMKVLNQDHDGAVHVIGDDDDRTTDGRGRSSSSDREMISGHEENELAAPRTPVEKIADKDVIVPVVKQEEEVSVVASVPSAPSASVTPIAPGIATQLSSSPPRYRLNGKQTPDRLLTSPLANNDFQLLVITDPELKKFFEDLDPADLDAYQRRFTENGFNGEPIGWREENDPFEVSEELREEMKREAKENGHEMIDVVRTDNGVPENFYRKVWDEVESENEVDISVQDDGRRKSLDFLGDGKLKMDKRSSVKARMSTHRLIGKLVEIVKRILVQEGLMIGRKVAKVHTAFHSEPQCKEQEWHTDQLLKKLLTHKGNLAPKRMNRRPVLAKAFAKCKCSFPHAQKEAVKKEVPTPQSKALSKAGRSRSVSNVSAGSVSRSSKRRRVRSNTNIFDWDEEGVMFSEDGDADGEKDFGVCGVCNVDDVDEQQGGDDGIEDVVDGQDLDERIKQMILGQPDRTCSPPAAILIPLSEEGSTIEVRLEGQQFCDGHSCRGVKKPAPERIDPETGRILGISNGFEMVDSTNPQSDRKIFVANWPTLDGETLVGKPDWKTVNQQSKMCYLHPTTLKVSRGSIAMWLTPSLVHAGSYYEKPNSRLYMALDTLCGSHFKDYRLPTLETLETEDKILTKKGLPVKRAVTALKQGVKDGKLPEPWKDIKKKKGGKNWSGPGGSKRRFVSVARSIGVNGRVVGTDCSASGVRKTCDAANDSKRRLLILDEKQFLKKP